jgi:tRNA-uridine 2-sulfurtransferase
MYCLSWHVSPGTQSRPAHSLARHALPVAGAWASVAGMTHSSRALALFSGGLDSILAMKVVRAQGVRVLGLHFCSPFFGHPEKMAHWRDIYDLELETVDAGQAFVDLLLQGPRFGYGKVLNPCVDCKILMLSTAKALLATYGAGFLISGEVLGQRPMSQRRDTLNLITKQAGVRDCLLRPLSALHFKPTPMELEGLVQRSELLNISGRGRKDQLRLAEEFGLPEIPTPAGGCLLAEQESAKRFWPVLTRIPYPAPADFELAKIGRQYWNSGLWLMVGRNQADNQALESLATAEDILFKAADVQGPLALGRRKIGIEWTDAHIRMAAAFVAGFSMKKRVAGQNARMRITLAGGSSLAECGPEQVRAAQSAWAECAWTDVKQEKQAVSRTGQP